MEKHALWKWLILVLLVAGSLVVVTPPGEKIRLGLDLRGGTSFIVKVDEAGIREEIRQRAPDLPDEDVEAEVRRALRDAPARALEVIRNRIDGLGIEEPIIYPGTEGRIIIQLPGIDEERRREAERAIRSAAFLEFRLVHPRNSELVQDLFARSLAPEGFRVVDLGGDQFYRPDPNFPATARDEEYQRRLGAFQVPDAEYQFMLEKDEREGQTVYRPAFVKRRAEMKGDLLKDAQVGYGPLNQPQVDLEFDGQGAKQFARVTSDYAPRGARNQNSDVGRQLAIVLDGTLYSAPYIIQPIYDGKAQITGQFSVPEATLLANVLRSGSLPAPVRVEETRFVSPTLGQDSINSGIRAILIGGIAVIVFMMAYYTLCGAVADLALLLNMLILPLGMIVAAGFLGIFAREGATGGPIKLPVLTLPGIAGILLTVGMAVDANVLIFERIREEMKTGKRLWASIVAGYDRAFITIIDANLTTLLTGVILFVFGSGPIRGFAVTLCAGILVSMFTALVVTRLFFDVMTNKAGVSKLKMFSIVGDTRIDFVGRRKIAAIASLAVIVLTLAFGIGKFLQSPARVFGVDFTGGSALTLVYDERQPLDEVRGVLESAGLPSTSLQYQSEMEQGGDSYLVVKIGVETAEGTSPGHIAEDALQAAFPDAGFSLEQEDLVGSQVGDELKRRAMWSILLALVAIILYIAWRFELGFAVGAIVALAHDVLVTGGIFILLGQQLSLPVVAALLTIVGYSVNDTIVVFDRIREDLRVVRDKSFPEICNLSINQTLSRTLLTSLTTLIAVGSLLIFGGGAIYDFALALCIGVLVGTYSSIFVATPVVLMWHRNRMPEFSTQARLKQR